MGPCGKAVAVREVGGEMTPGYLEVPVEAAQEIALRYKKDVVIVCAWDRRSGMIHVTTFGSDAEAKRWAASGGSICMEALGGDLAIAAQFADFREDLIRGLEEQVRELAAKLAGAADLRDAAREYRERYRELHDPEAGYGMDSIDAGLREAGDRLIKKVREAGI